MTSSSTTLDTADPAPRAPGRRAAKRDTRKQGGSLAAGHRRLFAPFVLPAIVLYTVLFVIPIGAAVWISLNKWAGSGPMTFVGLQNYVNLMSDKIFIQSLVNTLKLLFIVGGAIFILAFAMSLVLRDMMGRKTARAIIFFPHLVNSLVYGVLAGFIFNPGGLVNSALAAIGIHNPPEWLARDNMFGLIMLTMVLVTVGYYTTILMAGVDRIPPYFYEDCALAGANAWQRLRYVILPLTWDVFAVCAVLWTISSVKIFEIVWIFGGAVGSGVPPTQTWTAAVYTYATAFSGESVPAFGAGAASAIFSLLLVSVLVFLLRRATRRDVIEF